MANISAPSENIAAKNNVKKFLMLIASFDDVFVFFLIVLYCFNQVSLLRSVVWSWSSFFEFYFQTTGPEWNTTGHSLTTETWKSNILAYIYFSANFLARSAKNTELGLADSTPDLEITLEACCVLFCLARPGRVVPHHSTAAIWRCWKRGGVERALRVKWEAVTVLISWALRYMERNTLFTVYVNVWLTNR